MIHTVYSVNAALSAEIIEIGAITNKVLENWFFFWSAIGKILQKHWGYLKKGRNVVGKNCQQNGAPAHPLERSRSFCVPCQGHLTFEVSPKIQFLGYHPDFLG